MATPTDQELRDRSFGDFVLLREIGRGGMGVVFEARQVSLNRRVALKLLAAGPEPSSQAVERFHREAEAAAKLHHPHIVPIYAIGEHDGTYYYAMELMQGASLAHVLRRFREELERPAKPAAPTPAPQQQVNTVAHVATVPEPSYQEDHFAAFLYGGSYLDTVARMVADVADALEHAHQQGVIHRDIKPSNLLLDNRGRLSVNDFGLARILEKPGITVTGDFVGTPAYTSPEQITAGRVPLDHRTDIYSLGATLYEMLTLRRPFAGESRDQVLAQILHKDPPPLRNINKKVPLDLETICLKALEKDPDRRYAAAREMAADLRRYLKRLPIQARRTGLVGRAVKWVRRHPAVTGMLLCLGLAVLVASVFGWQAYLTEQQRQTADDQRRSTEAQRLAEKRQNAVEMAELAAMGGDFDKAKAALAEAERLGLSTAQGHLLRSQLAYYAGDTKEATQQFAKLVEVAWPPRRETAHALLAGTFLEVDDWGNLMTALYPALRLQPVTPEDSQFLGKTQAWQDPEKTLKNLTLAMQKRPSVIVRLAHAEILLGLARDRGDAVKAEQAAREADFVKRLLPHNPVALKLALEARTVAIYAYAGAAQKAQRDQASALARPDAVALQKFPHFAYSLQMRWEFLRALGEQDKLLAELSTSVPQDEYVMTLYHQGEFEKARAALGKTIWPMCDCLVLCEFPEGRAEALDRYRQLVKDPATVSWHKLTSQLVPLLLGHLGESRTACRAYRQQKITSPLKNAEFQRALDYLAGELSAADYLKSTGASRIDQSNAHFFIGLTHLAQGDRRTARDHFQKGKETGSFNFIHFELCWALHARMQRDAAWPPWLAP